MSFKQQTLIQMAKFLNQPLSKQHPASSSPNVHPTQTTIATSNQEQYSQSTAASSVKGFVLVCINTFVERYTIFVKF